MANIEGTFRCSIKDCSAVFECKRSLKWHIEAIHEDNYHPCGICGKQFKRKCSREIHEQTQHREGDYKSSEGKHPENDSINMEVNGIDAIPRQKRKSHKPKKIYPCSICNSSFTTSANCDKHYKTYHYDASGLGKPGNREMHYKTVHKGERNIQNGVDYEQEVGTGNHELTENTEIDEKEECDIKTEAVEPINTVIKVENVDPMEEESFGGKTETLTQTVEQPIKKRSRKKAYYTCPICKDIFTAKSSCVKHYENIHNGNGGRRSYPCEICKKSYSTNSTRDRHHRNVHNGATTLKELEENSGKIVLPKIKQPTKYPCAFCNMTFARKGRRERHYRLIHNGPRMADREEGEVGAGYQQAVAVPILNRYQCDICKRIFDNHEHLKRHNFAHEYDKTLIERPLKPTHIPDLATSNIVDHVAEVAVLQRNDEGGITFGELTDTGYIIYDNPVIKEKQPEPPLPPKPKPCKPVAKVVKNPCEICGKGFKFNYTRKRHYLIIHNIDFNSSSIVDPVKYPCEICGKMFLTSFNRKRHYSTKHANANNLTDLENGDQEETTPKVQFPCEICGALFAYKFNLNKHIKLKHMDSNLSKYQQYIQNAIARYTNNQPNISSVEEVVIKKELPVNDNDPALNNDCIKEEYIITEINPSEPMAITNYIKKEEDYIDDSIESQ